MRGDERTDTKSGEELKREARHQKGAERRVVTDANVGEDRILQKGIGGYGAEKGTAPAREAPQLSDTSERHH